jgi:hypothetical protein
LEIVEYLRLSFGIIEAFKFVGALHFDYCRGDTPSPNNLVEMHCLRKENIMPRQALKSKGLS